MVRGPPMYTRTDTLCPYATLFPSRHQPAGHMLDGASRLCLNGAKLHHFSVVSSHAEYSVVPESGAIKVPDRSVEHTSELQSLMRISYAVFCLKKNTTCHNYHSTSLQHLHYQYCIVHHQTLYI